LNAAAAGRLQLSSIRPDTEEILQKYETVLADFVLAWKIVIFQKYAFILAHNEFTIILNK
jgi:hypothetical protein